MVQEHGWRRRSVLGAAIGGATLPFLGTARAADKPPVKIGWLAALTGPNSSPGIGFNRGIEFATQILNEAGGIGGRQIEIVTRDTQGDPTKAVNAALEVVSQQRVEFLLGPTNSGESLATEPVTARYKVPSLLYSVVDSLVDIKRYPYYFRQLPSNTQWTEAAQNYVLKVLKAQKVGVIGDATGYGTATLHLAASEFKKAGGDVVYTTLIDPNATDATAEMQKAKQAGAEALLVWSDSAGLNARIMNARGGIGWDAPMIGHPAMGTGIVKNLLKQPSYWDKVYIVGYRSTSFDSEGQLPVRTRDFLKLVGNKVKLSDTTLWWVACGYDSVNLIKWAIDHGGSSEPAAVKRAWESLTSYPGIFGDYSYSATNHNGYPTAEVVMNAADSFKNGAYSLAPGY